TDLGGERHPDTRLAVAIPQPTNLELTDRDEAAHAHTAPQKLGRVPMKLQLSEWQREGTIAQIDLNRFGFYGGAARKSRSTIRCRPHREPMGEAEVVEIGGQPCARVEGLVDRAVLPEEESVGVHGRRQIVVLAILLFGVQERHLGEREETIRTEPR